LGVRRPGAGGDLVLVALVEVEQRLLLDGLEGGVGHPGRREVLAALMALQIADSLGDG